MVMGPSWNASAPNLTLTLRTSAPNTIKARLSSAVETPTVAKIWICGSAVNSGWMMKRCTNTPTPNRSSATGTTVR